MLAPGSEAPDFRLADVNGGETTLHSLLAKGKVLLVFFKISCPTCQLTLPFLERLHQGGRVAVTGISQDDADDTAAFSTRLGLTFPMLLDLEETNYLTSNAFQITTVPSLFLVSEAGAIEWTLHGFSRKALEALGHRVESTVFRPEDRVQELKPG
jgi:peroxiredoxin